MTRCREDAETCRTLGECVQGRQRDQPCVPSVLSAQRAEDLLGSGVSAAPPPGWEAGATRTLSTLGRAGLQGCGR